MPTNKKKRSSAKKQKQRGGSSSTATATATEANKDDVVKNRLETLFLKCSIERAEDLEQRFQSTWPPTMNFDTLPRNKRYDQAYNKVSNHFNAGLKLVPKSTPIVGLSRWHLVLEKMMDALEVVTKKGNEGVQYVFLETTGKDHRNLLCKVISTVAQMFSKMCLLEYQKAWSKVAIATDPTYYKGYSQLSTAVIHVDDDWELALNLAKKAYAIGLNNKKSQSELGSIKQRITMLESVVHGGGSMKKKVKMAKHSYLNEQKGAALRLWQDMGIPRPSKTCNFCWIVKRDLSTCAKCQAVYYCSVRCQTVDYKEHRHVCVEPSKENLIDIIQNPKFSDDEVIVDEAYWQSIKISAKKNKSPILVTVANDCILSAVKRAMMYEGGNVNEKCPHTKEYPIMVAALRNEPDNAVAIVRTLIQHGACPNVVRYGGQHLLAMCRERAKWIDDTEPSTGNQMFRMETTLKSALSGLGDDKDGNGDGNEGQDEGDILMRGCEREERRESAELVQLVTSAIQQHKLCSLCKARKNRKGFDAHLTIGCDMTSNHLKSYDRNVDWVKNNC